MLNTSSQARQLFIRLGGHSGLVDAYLAAVIGIMGVAAAGYAVAAVLRLHAEESERRAEPVLAAPVGRVRWAGGHLVVAGLGSAGLLVVGGVAMALGEGLTSGGLATLVPRLAGAGLAQVPAVWVMAGLAVGVFGLAPRIAVPVAWTALGVAALITLLGPAIRLSHWVLDVSPFSPYPEAAWGACPVAPLVWLVVVAAGAGRGGAGRVPAARPHVTGLVPCHLPDVGGGVGAGGAGWPWLARGSAWRGRRGCASFRPPYRVRLRPRHPPRPRELRPCPAGYPAPPVPTPPCVSPLPVWPGPPGSWHPPRLRERRWPVCAPGTHPAW